MTFCIITHVVHTEKEGIYYAYSPYINEMNLWLKHVDHVVVVAPKENFSLNPIHAFYHHSSINFVILKRFDTLSWASKIKAMIALPGNCWNIFKAMQKSDHIHLRCPGNIGLLGAIVQVFFPNKPKTAKYAGNWDPKSKQPLSYRLQKWILNNTFLTKKMQVLVYGEWENQTKNIKPFFTATYNESDKVSVAPRSLKEVIQFVFVGTLTKGKQPLYAIQLVEKLKNLDFPVQLSIYGEGKEREALKHYITLSNLKDVIFLKGNLDKNQLKEVYQKSHFLILPSKSEGWPKVIAEAMFWGCLPIATPVSCVPNMLDFGNRGILLSEIIAQDVKNIAELLIHQDWYDAKIKLSVQWSHNYTIDTFENEIKRLLRP